MTSVGTETRTGARDDATIADRGSEPPGLFSIGEHPVGDLGAVALGLAAGLSPLFLGYYADTVWAALGVCVVAAAAVMVGTGRVPIPSTRALVALGGLAGLGVWALVSTLWSPSSSGALIGAGRLLGYAGVTLVALGLARDRRRRVLLLGAVGAGLALVAIVTLARLLGPGAPSLFLAGRLSGPLGYAGGTACALVLGAWLFVGVALRPRPLEAAAGAFGVVLLACLAVLAESRSSVPATALAVVAVLVVHGSARTAWAILVAGAGVAAAFPVLEHVYSGSGPLGRVSGADAHAAGLATLAAAAVTAVVWGLGTALTDRVRERERGADTLRRASRLGLAITAVLAVLALAAAAGPISRGVRTQWRAFTELHVVSPEQTHGESRLLQGGGPLEEYWRVALHTAADHPVGGAGAGGWTKAWFQDRRYYDQVWQPNSIVFGTVAELGLVGTLLLAAFGGGTAVAVWRTRRGHEASRSPSVVAAVGLAAASLSYATTDWIWVGLPGVMAIGLIAVGVLLAARGSQPRRQPRSRRRSRRRVQRTWRIGVVAVSAVAALLLGRTAVASALQDDAAHSIVADPTRAVARADASLTADPGAVRTSYVKAAALARLDKPDQARAALVDARDREPDNFVTWALLGDLDLRRRDLARAQAEYHRAAQLDPMDAGSAAGFPLDLRASLQFVGPRPTNVARRANVVGYQIVKDTSPLELARALGAPGLRQSDEVVVGLFGYGVG
jgi:hypothetical protein